MGGHGGGGGFSVGAGDAHGVFVVLHNGAPGLRPLKYRHPLAAGRGDLRVVVVDGGGADEELSPCDVLGGMAHGDRDAQGTQMLHRGAVGHVAALDRKSHAVEHLRQRAHGDASNAGEMDPAAGRHILLDLGFNMGHGKRSFPNGESRYLHFSRSYIILYLLFLRNLYFRS